ncbi:MAG: diguanylate cyclase [Spirochaetales bacterium]|nr:diguanylate cyclase [Spirochaetales bacterium]
MSNDPKKKFKGPYKGLSLNVYLFLFFLLIGIFPLIFQAFLDVNSIKKHLLELETEYDSVLLQLQTSPLESRIDTYSELVKFVSQLPAVAEILDRGQERAGSVERDVAFKRYKGVITRAFKKYPDIINIHIHDAAGEELLSISRQADQNFSINSESTELPYNKELTLKIISMVNDDLLIIPYIKESVEGYYGVNHSLLLRMAIPIIFDGEKIGYYISDIDIGILSLSFPSVKWVFSDGSFLTPNPAADSAFELFPGLEKLFQTGESGVCGDSLKIAWSPLYSSEEGGLVLWAGMDIRYEFVHHSTEQIFTRLIVVSSVLGGLSFILIFAFATQMRRFFLALLESLGKIILHEDIPVYNGSNVAELNHFMAQMQALGEEHKRLEDKNKAANESLRKSEWLLHTMANAVQSAIFLVDNQARFVYFNPAAERMFGYSRAEIKNKSIYETVIPKKDCSIVKEKFSAFFKEGGDLLLDNTFEMNALNKDGNIFPIELRVGSIYRDGAWRVVGSAIDISARKRREETLTKMAETDPLTGVNNRRNFMILAGQEIKKCRRYRKSVHFLMFDLDFFKSINDSLGHAFGDKVLKCFSDICVASLRGADIFARIGGEEFASVLVDLDTSIVLKVAERIRTTFHDSQLEDEGTIVDLQLSVSIGVAEVNIMTDDVESALKNADHALYTAKDQGRNCVVLYS